MKHQRLWTEEETAFVLAHYKEYIKPVLIKKMKEELGYERSVQSLKGFYQRHHLNSGMKGQFEKGMVPVNKGKKVSPEVYEKLKRTMFKKGQRPHNALPVGTEILWKDSRKKDGHGYWYVKVAEPRVWKAKHHLLWESVNGPIPEGHIVIFLDGDTNNVTIENLRMIKQADSVVVNNIFAGQTLSAAERNIAIDIAEMTTRIHAREKKK